MRSFGNQFRRFLDAEDGGAYTLSYVMVIPILMLLTCVTIETAMVMNAKVGTTYAAWSGARTAIVWSSADPNWENVEQRIEDAVVQSFTPFASGMGKKKSPPDRASHYARSYREFVDDPAAVGYLNAKYANAADRLKVTIENRPSKYNSDISVKVEYRFRFNIPGIGKLLGEKDGDDYSFPLESTVTLQNEGPKNDSQTLGIGYGTFN